METARIVVMFAREASTRSVEFGGDAQLVLAVLNLEAVEWMILLRSGIW